MADVIRWVFASLNRHKWEEVRVIWRNYPFEVLFLGDVCPCDPPEESGSTFLDNALIKARSAWQLTGLPSVADDSGLEVDALEGQPGVRSSCFAGEKATDVENNQKLLALLRDIPSEKRQARFRCVVAWVGPNGEHWEEGVCEGQILHAPRGSGGFGYDPLFFLPQLGKTFSEMTLEEKNGYSHRGLAFRKMGDYLLRTIRDFGA